MGEIIYLRPVVPDPVELNYVIGHDEFAVTIRIEGHRLFFVRVEVDTSTPLVTDFQPGDVDDAALNIALSIGLREARVSVLGMLVFCDVVSDGCRPANRAALLAARAKVQRAADHVGLERGQVVDRIAFADCNGKVDIVVSFAKRA